MKVHITNLYGQAQSSVALIAQNMVAKIGHELGFKEIGFFSFKAADEPRDKRLVRFDGMNAAVGDGDLVIIQGPSWNGTAFDVDYFHRLKLYPRLKIVIFVHDIVPLMFEGNFYLMDDVLSMYNQADALILPSEKMHKRLIELGLTNTRVVYQKIWDHLTDTHLQKATFKKRLHFAGSPNRFPFLKEWKYDVPLSYYAFEQIDEIDQMPTLDFEGWYQGDQLLQHLAEVGGFGLVWPQGSDSNYYELNVSYKLSTYLAAGIPVIIPPTLSNAEIIVNNGLGYIANNLEEACALVNDVTATEYDELLNRVNTFAELIRQGYFSKKVLIEAIHSALTKD